MALTVYEDIERCFEGGWSDGLPVVPPYGSLVDRMLGEMGWKPTEVVGRIKAQNIEIRAEHLAATAVMAGCKFEYGRLLRALCKGLMDPRLNLSGAEVTTGGVKLDEVDHRTMQSKLKPGLFLVGEVLDLDGWIGGYNFQSAWSTGWLAGGVV